MKRDDGNKSAREAFVVLVFVTALALLLILLAGCAISIDPSDRIRLDAATREIGRLSDQLEKSDVEVQRIAKALEDLAKHVGDVLKIVNTKPE